MPDECEIASGTSPDCNTNSVPDECDLAAGASADVNANAVPDECERPSLILSAPHCPADAVPVELVMRGLLQAVNGVQVLLNYDAAVLALDLAATTEAPGWTRILLSDNNGAITYALIYNGGSVGPGDGPFTVATLVFDTISEGTTDVVFRPDQPPFLTRITLANNGGAISGDDLVKTDSGLISIDYTVPTADNNGPVCAGDPVQLLGEPDGMAEYVWTGSNGFTSTEQNPTIDPAVPGEYCLIVRNSEGCEFGPVCTTVEVYACLTPIITIPGLTGGEVDREVEVVLTSCNGSQEVRTAIVHFTPSGGSGVGTLLLADVDPDADWVSVREGHTLSTLAAVSLNGGSASVGVTLQSGDLQTAGIPQDDVVDVLDFAILASSWGFQVTECGGNPQNCSLGADVTGDGWQDQNDFTLMQQNFFEVSDAEDGCGSGGGIAPRPIISIAVAQLAPHLPQAARADLNRDGEIDAKDVRAFARLKKVSAAGFEARLLEAAPTAIDFDQP